MDTGEGVFRMVNDEALSKPLKQRVIKPAGNPNPNLFSVGEEVELKGSLFRVKSIKPTELRLKLLKRRKADD